MSEHPNFARSHAARRTREARIHDERIELHSMAVSNSIPWGCYAESMTNTPQLEALLPPCETRLPFLERWNSCPLKKAVLIRLWLIVVMCLFSAAAPVWADTQAAEVDTLKERAAQGDAVAQLTLGFLYSEGDGVPQDYVQARKWLRLAASRFAIAQNRLGWMYANGEGVPQDYVQALKWYRLAAAQGEATAQFNMGTLYHEGKGVPQDYAEALKWYRLAAAQGEATAQFNLGIMYSKGDGVPQDHIQAAKWYRLAAAQGEATAQFNLGIMYSKGDGVPQDYVQAHKWTNLAAAALSINPQPNGPPRNEVVKVRDIVAARMTLAQIADAQKLAREWQKQEAVSPTGGP